MIMTKGVGASVFGTKSVPSIQLLTFISSEVKSFFWPNATKVINNNPIVNSFFIILYCGFILFIFKMFKLSLNGIFYFYNHEYTQYNKQYQSNGHIPQLRQVDK